MSDSMLYYHGTKADLRAGDMIEPGYTSNYGKRKLAAFVYLSATLVRIRAKSWRRRYARWTLGGGGFREIWHGAEGLNLSVVTGLMLQTAFSVVVLGRGDLEALRAVVSLGIAGLSE